MTNAAVDSMVEIEADAEALAVRAADWLLEQAMASTERFAVALSGGSTPRRLYQLLASPPWRERFPWPRTHWFWGDERFVPHDDPASNYRMVHEAMFSQAPVPPANIHPMPTEGLDAAQAAREYEATLKRFYGADTLMPDRPLFDVVLLGLGTDGHTASLFPGTSVLGERQRWVREVTDAKVGTRLTLTYPALESSRAVTFLVAGADKRAMLARLLDGDSALPSAGVHPQGELRFLVDGAAAEAP